LLRLAQNHAVFWPSTRAIKTEICDQRYGRNGQIALHQFRTAQDRNGSIARITAPQHCCLLHLPFRLKTSAEWTAGQCQERTHAPQQNSTNLRPSSAGASSVVDKVNIGRTLRVTTWHHRAAGFPKSLRPLHQKRRFSRIVTTKIFAFD
jgi:hypothetical protein